MTMNDDEWRCMTMYDFCVMTTMRGMRIKIRARAMTRMMMLMMIVPMMLVMAMMRIRCERCYVHCAMRRV